MLNTFWELTKVPEFTQSELLFQLSSTKKYRD